MYSICAKLYMRGKDSKYRKMLSTTEEVFDSISTIVDSTVPYSPETLLSDGEWYEIRDVSKQEYAIDLIKTNYQSIDYDSMKRTEFSNIHYIFFERDKDLYFQNIGKSKLASKKRIGSFGEQFKYQSDSKEIVINQVPDAIYCKAKDSLYFRKLESITGIFRGIDQLYREATDGETTSFLENDFIQLQNDYDASCVKTQNRRRIAVAIKTLNDMEKEDRKNIFTYIADYCPELKTESEAFSVGSEDDLKLVLYGIEQRFYTTLVGGEKRIANSVILLKNS